MTEAKSPGTHRFPVWGIILLFLGVLLLLQNFDILPWGLWGTLWRFWPALLIIIGINIIVGRYKPWLAGIIVLVVLGACLGLAIWQYESPTSGEATSTYSELRGDLREARVEIDFKAGDSSLSALPLDSPNLVEAISRGNGLKVDFHREDGTSRLRLSTVWGRRPFWRRVGMEWEVRLTRSIPLTVDVDSAAANVELDLSRLKVTQLDLEMNAGNCNLKMPSSPGVTQASIEANAANVEIIIPEGVATRIEADVNVGSLEIDEDRFPKKGDYHISPNFEDSESLIYLKIDCNAGRVKVQ